MQQASPFAGKLRAAGGRSEIFVIRCLDVIANLSQTECHGLL